VIVVTGASGFIGLHTVEELVRREHCVVAVDITIDKLLEKFRQSPKVTIVQKDILDGDIDTCIREGDKVVHLAAVSTFAKAQQNPIEAIRVNVEGTVNIIKACIEKKAERLVFSSTGSVYSKNVKIPIREDSPRKPFSVYGLTKKQAEDWIMHFGDRLRYVILRYGYVYGEGKNWGAIGSFLDRISKGLRPIIYGGEQTNDFVYVKDIVKANILALETEHTNDVYNVGSGRAVSIRDVCRWCIEAMGRNIEPKIEPLRNIDYLEFLYDITKAKTWLGYNPTYTVKEGIRIVAKSLS